MSKRDKGPIEDRVNRARRQERAALFVHGLTGKQKAEALKLLFLPERIELERLREAKSARLENAKKASAESEQRAHEAERRHLDTLKAIVATGVEQAKRSEYSIAELRRGGLTVADGRAIGNWRRGAITTTAAAKYLGVPKGRLERWVSEGVVSASFRRRVHISGAGSVLARYWTSGDLDRLKERLAGLTWLSAANKRASR